MLRGLLTVALVGSLAAFASADVSTAVPSWTGPMNPSVTFVDEYQYDDGTTENALGLTSGGDLAWMHYFEELPGLNTITAVSTAYGYTGGSPPPNGQYAGVYVWEDPNDDGNPLDAVLLAQVDTVVANAGTDILQVNALASPVAISGGFFIGAMTANAAGQFQAPMDESTPYGGQAWISYAVGGGWEPSSLPADATLEMGSIGYPAYFLLRGNAVPEPATLGLLALGALGLLRRRR